MIERIPERFRTANVARAATSPSGLLLAGAGASVAILAGAPLAFAAVAGGLAWLARVAMAAPRRRPGEHIDPFALGEPWRSMVRDAQQARARFDRTVDRAREGPLRDRLGDIARRIDDAVRECWRIACEGDALENAMTQLDPHAVEEELARARDDRKRRRGGDAALDRTIAALEAQLSSAERLAVVWRDARDRLRLLNAQLDEAVARAIELSVRSGSDVGSLTPLVDEVETLVGDLEALRQALEETGGQSATSTG